ncbi:DNA gyrase inhibitor YacG [Paludisphaera rhizosphaerae]|uniref:DNA gyrase inhibitor YacG n=1 Tax=Paludisphaera rhizosphaerae TaxID=2711216 RepID=UPI0013EC7E9B|nr:DNA gyrase inhibitor YacG [Paludisphaera rhizosphaerae]
MINGRCPICTKSFQVDRIDDLPSFPFCSDRCRLVDLGRWIDGSYSIPDSPARPVTGDSDADPADSTSEVEADD